MIKISRKENCVGCNACVQKCPKHCIDMHEDEQGFIYPEVDINKCVDCHLCEQVCPVINQAEPRKPLETYAAKNLNEEVKMASSSGGIFYALAKNIIDEGGVVFGAKFNDKWEVVHDYTETIEGLKAFQGSKYVQSRIGDTFHQAEKFLKEGRKVMFTGTPCQIAALGLFLRKDYGDQLLKVDVVCHGVPSPLVWREYLNYITRPKGASDGKNTVLSSLKGIPVITGISFRDKRLGWEKFGFSVRIAASSGSGKNSVFQSVECQNQDEELLFEPLDKNIFMQGFLKDLYLRPSCYKCPTKQLKSESDITLGDFWNINNIDPKLHENGYYSLILTNSSKGLKILESASIEKSKAEFSKAITGNPAIEYSVKKPKEYEIFWNQLHKNGILIISYIVRSMKPSLPKRLIYLICRIRGKVLKIIGLKK